MSCGVILIDKAEGPTSHDIVNDVRRLLGVSKVGHAGTLDPMATGLLVILLGDATKISQYLMDEDKEYKGTCLWGAFTDTADRTGKVVEEIERTFPDEKKIKNAMGGFIGRQKQMPPMFSAKKVNGQPLYKQARKGKTIQREAATIIIHSFELDSYGSESFDFLVNCGKGTYIRTLMEDICKFLEGAGHIGALQRTRCGEFKIENAVTLEELKTLVDKGQAKKVIISLEDACGRFPKIVVNDSAAQSMPFGHIALPDQIVTFDNFEMNKPARVFDQNGELLALVLPQVLPEKMSDLTKGQKTFKFLTNFCAKNAQKKMQ